MKIKFGISLLSFFMFHTVVATGSTASTANTPTNASQQALNAAIQQELLHPVYATPNPLSIWPTTCAGQSTYLCNPSQSWMPGTVTPTIPAASTPASPAAATGSGTTDSGFNYNF